MAVVSGVMDEEDQFSLYKTEAGRICYLYIFLFGVGPILSKVLHNVVFYLSDYLVRKIVCVCVCSIYHGIMGENCLQQSYK